MPKTNYVPVQGLDPIAGEHPVGVQTRFKATTGPFIPRSIEAGGGVVTISMWARGDVTSKHIDDLPVQREDLVNSDHVEVTGDDLQAIYEIYRRVKGDRERLITEAAGYDGTTVSPAAQGPAVHVDGDGTVLTPQEVAARQGGVAAPGLEEAQAWWREQTYIDDDYEDVAPSVLVGLVATIPLNEVEYIDVLESEAAVGSAGYEPSPHVAAAVKARQDAHAEAAAAPGWSPLEDGLPIVEVRARLEKIGDARVVADLLEVERKGKGRKRHLQALENRLDELTDVAAEPEPQPAEVPPLPGEAEGAVAEDPF